jgi:sporulation protein YlmC with PRC-barrel domain
MGFKLEDVDDVRGAPVVDKEGTKIGKVEDVFLDRHTGRPAWAAVKTGLFGCKHTLVPITDAFLNPNAEVQVPFAKDQVNEAPNIDPGKSSRPTAGARPLERRRRSPSALAAGWPATRAL